MTIQKTYTHVSVEAYPGMVVDIDSNNRVISLAAEGDIDFGLGVFRGTNKETQAKTAGLLFVGVAVRDHATASGYAGKYGDEEVAGVITEGPVWVELDGTGVPGAVLSVDKTNGKIGTHAVAGNYIAINAILQNTVAVSGDLAQIKLGPNK